MHAQSLRRIKINMKQFIFTFIFLFTVLFSYGQSDKKYLFYLHGRIIEDQGIDATSEQFGKYEYQSILDKFKESGFVVKSELRRKGTDVIEYSTELTNQVQELINTGTDPKNITIVGASKGALIAMLTSTQLQNQNVNFVIIANCNNWVKTNYEIKLCGRILSIYEESDNIGSSCQEIFSDSTCDLVAEEIVLKTGKKHGIIFKPLPEWIDPTVQWAKSEK